MSDLDGMIEAGRDLFGELGDISARKMFGGAGLYHDGLMFVLIADEEFYLKAEGGFAEELEAMDSAPFTYEGKGKPMQMSYWRLPESAYDDPDEAVALARKALDCARAAKKPKQK